jgi:predicted metal-binding protein
MSRRYEKTARVFRKIPLAAPDKILRKVRSIAEFRVDALHFSFCMTAVCPFLNQYEEIIKEKYPNLELVRGTHQPVDKKLFLKGLHELLCPTVAPPQTIVDMIRGTIKLPS